MLKNKKRFLLFLFLLIVLYAKPPQKIGLVLSGGGSKGFAHIPTLKAIDSLKIPIDYIAGSSFGAIVGAMYALGYSGKQIEQMAMDTDWYEVQKDEPERKYLPYFRKKDTGKYQLEFGLDGFKPVQPTGLIYGQKIILDLSKWTREYEQVFNFDSLPIPFRCNAFDIVSGKEIILKEGSLAHALRASLSLPTIFAPVEWGDALLVDGGVANNLPVDIVKDMGADIVLAIDVSATHKSKKNLDNIYEVVSRTMSVRGDEETIKSIKKADYYIKPKIPQVSFTDYRKNTMEHLFLCGQTAVDSNWGIFLELKTISEGRIPKHQNIIPLKKPNVNRVIVKGNKILSNRFIRSYIGLEKGMILDPALIDKGIADLYSLGYFKILYYEIHKITNQSVDVIINVKETPLRKFNLGLRWDNYYHLVGALNVQITSDLLPGLRIEDELQFAGITKNEFSISFPSRRLNLPLYPYIKVINSRIPYKLFSAENNFEGYYELRSDGIKTGLGILLKNFWNTELEYFSQTIGFQSEKYISNSSIIDDNNDIYSIDNRNISGFRIKANFDILDDVLLPNDGIIFNGELEESNNKLGSDWYYKFYKIEGTAYRTFHLNTYGITVYYHNLYNHAPYHKTIITNGSQTFVGMEEFQLHGKEIFFGRLDYRYRYKKDIFANFIINYLVNANDENSVASAKNIWSFGTGITFLSPLGPLKFIWGWSPGKIYTDTSSKNIFYFSAGYKF